MIQSPKRADYVAGVGAHAEVGHAADIDGDSHGDDLIIRGILRLGLPLPRGKKLAKLLLEKALVVAAELPEDPQERARMVAMLAGQMARDRGSPIEDDAADELADLCNCDLAAMQSEIEKLATYAGAGRPIRRADVEALVVSEKKYSVWELAEVLATRQRTRAFQFLTSVLQQGEAAPRLIGLMAWMFRKLIEAQQLSPQTTSYQAAGRLQMGVTTAEIALRHARKIPRRQLVEGLRVLYDADSRLKGGSTNDRAVMEFVVAQLTASGAADEVGRGPRARLGGWRRQPHYPLGVILRPPERSIRGDRDVVGPCSCGAI